MLEQLLADIKFAVLANKVEKFLNATCNAYANLATVAAQRGAPLMATVIKAAGKHQDEIKNIAKDVQCALDHIDMAVKSTNVVFENIMNDPAVEAARKEFMAELEQNQQLWSKEMTKSFNNLMKLFK